MPTPSSSVPIFIIEAFTVSSGIGSGETASSSSGSGIPGSGNPAAVCLLQYDDEISDERKQSIAQTLNVSTTAFVSRGWSHSKQGEGFSFYESIRTLEKQDKETDEPGSLRLWMKRTIRWFTPQIEIPLCGHATLASTKAILTQLPDNLGSSFPSIEKEREDQSVDRSFEIEIEFQSKLRGALKAIVSSTFDSSSHKITDKFITLNFPANETIKIEVTNPTDASSWILAFTGNLLGPSFTHGRQMNLEGNFPVQNEDQDTTEKQKQKQKQPLDFITDLHYSPAEKILLFRLKQVESEHPAETIARVQPDFEMLMKASASTGRIVDGTPAVIVTIAGIEQENKEDATSFTDTAKYPAPDFYSRFFAPFIGINEDAVTGTAHTILVPYWTKVLKSGKNSSKLLYARQVSARRGDLLCELVKETDAAGQEMTGQRVNLSGKARILVKGELTV